MLARPQVRNFCPPPPPASPLSLPFSLLCIPP
jgi:hypothetical protein